MSIDKEFWYKKRVLITGHTGFKGSWLSLILGKKGSEIYGYALDPPTIPNLYTKAHIDQLVNSRIADIRNYNELLTWLKDVRPEIIFHMAAQPLVRESYKNPLDTYEINVMGTVNLLEAIRHTPGIKAVVNVTTDKCYENMEWHWGYRENEPMGGYDPYSNSKGCSELITSAFRHSFFNPKEYHIHGVALASARAGNVIGGGDWAKDRLIPDILRAIVRHEEVKIRSPHAFRPWQHVLEPLSGYMMLMERLYTDGQKYASAWNFGPDDRDVKNVEWIVNKLCNLWGEEASAYIDEDPQPHEANYLKLDCSKARRELGWIPRWSIEKALTEIVEWNKVWLENGDLRRKTEEQIDEYFEGDQKHEDPQ
jgi:CDP-glucose 4,6-dehydratase